MANQLGRIKSRIDPRTLDASAALAMATARIPDRCRWDQAVPHWTMGGNNQYGNCVIVTAAHMLDTWNANTNPELPPINDDSIIDLSREMRALNGYMIIDRLKWWRKKLMWGHDLWLFAQFDPHSPDLHTRSIALTGTSDIGLELPIAWQNAPVWTDGTGPAYRNGSWGLHSVPLVGYDEQYVYCATWGRLQPITAPALERYCDEAWMTVAPAWLRGDGRSPSGLDLETLYDELQAVTR